MTAMNKFNSLVLEAKQQKIQAAADADRISNQLKNVAVEMMADGHLQTWEEIWRLVTKLNTSKEGRRRMLMDARELYLTRIAK